MTPPIRRTGHPLDLIPFFRQWQPGAVRDLLYTLILGLGFGLFFSALYAYDLPRDRLAAQLRFNFVISICIALAIHGLQALGDTLLRSWLRSARGWPRRTYYIAVPTAGVFAGYFIGVTLQDPATLRHTIFTTSVVLSFGIISVLVSCVLLFAYTVRERELVAKARLEAEQRRALEAQLRMLQAQLEPHFLYNTLANAVGLIAPAPDQARLLLERLIDYLRATLAASREQTAPLQREVKVITAYLELMKLRMGERLRYRIEVDSEAAALPLPPMLLQPLVENAISHGLEPKIEGGEVALSAHIESDQLRIVVSDTGVGLRSGASAKPGGGVGLSNLRERLAALYGKAGSMAIASNAEGGVSVTLRIPL
jgi:signal transduction histidine kinase